MERKWTPGPWRVGYSDTNYPNKAVWADGGLSGASQVCVMTDDFSARNENAHLIAAAPDLYELVDLVHSSFGGGRTIMFTDDDIAAFAAVRAKARGETQ